MEKFDFNAFVRECYLRSEPSIDLNDVPAGNQVSCRDHRLSENSYIAILRENKVIDNEGNILDRRILGSCNMWMLQSGPKLF